MNILLLILIFLCKPAFADFNSGDTFGKGIVIQSNGVTQTGGGRTLNFASGVTVVPTGSAYQITTVSNSGNVGVGTTNAVARYPSNGSTVTASTLLYDNGTNVSIGTVTPSNLLTLSTTVTTLGVDLQERSNVIGGCNSFNSTLLHMDGANGGTIFTDSSCGAAAHTYSAIGNATTSTTQFKFGTASMLSDGSGDGISTPSSTDFDMGSGDFTYSFWVYQVAGSSAQYFVHRTISNGNDQVICWINASNQLAFDMQSTVASLAGYTTTSAVSILNGWHLLEFTRSGTNFYIFLDGVSQTLTVAQAIGSNSMVAGTSTLRIGLAQNGTKSFNGYIDELLIDKGTALHTANYTPPTGPFDTGADTSMQSIRLGENGINRFAVGYNGPLANFEIAPGTIGTNPRMSISSSGNVGIGSSYPGTALDVNGTIRSTTTGGVQFGTDGKVSILPSATTNGDIKFLTNNSEVMRISSTGNVGIGSTIPPVQLYTTGTGIISGVSRNYSGASDANTDYSDFRTSVASNLVISPRASGTLFFNFDHGAGKTFLCNGVAACATAITSAGNVGIGTTAGQFSFSTGGTPTSNLDVGGNEAIGLSYAGFVAAPTNGLIVQGNMGIGTSLPSSLLEVGAQKFNILSGGNVGIGSTTPNLPLIVTTSTSNNALAVAGQWGTAFVLGNTSALTPQIQAYTNLSQSSTTSIAINPTGGNVGIGSVSPGKILDIIGSSAPNVRIGRTGTYSGDTASISMYGATSNATSIGYRDGTGNTVIANGASIGSGELIVINNTSGNVGIGTLTPGQLLDVQGTVRILNNGNLTIAGNVGIGTTIPASRLTIGTSTLMQKVTTTNTACSTVCGQMGCFFGEDTGILGTLLDCADATADVCFCSK